MPNRFDAAFAKPVTYLGYLVLPLTAPLVLSFIERYLIPVSFLTPLTLVILLGFFALRLPPKTVFFWMVAYIAYVILMGYFVMDAPVTSPALRPFVRSGFILAGGITACLLADQRRQMQSNIATLFEIVSALPAAVIVSDISGNIQLMNEECKKLLQGHVASHQMLSFFSTFMSREHQGREIQKYLSYFEKADGGPFLTVLHTRGERPLILQVTIKIATFSKARLAVTIIENSQEEASVG